MNAFRQKVILTHRDDLPYLLDFSIARSGNPVEMSEKYNCLRNSIRYWQDLIRASFDNGGFSVKSSMQDVTKQ